MDALNILKTQKREVREEKILHCGVGQSPVQRGSAGGVFSIAAPNRELDGHRVDRSVPASGGPIAGPGAGYVTRSGWVAVNSPVQTVATKCKIPGIQRPSKKSHSSLEEHPTSPPSQNCQSAQVEIRTTSSLEAPGSSTFPVVVVPAPIPAPIPKTAEPAALAPFTPAKKGPRRKGTPEAPRFRLRSPKNSSCATPTISSNMCRVTLRPGRGSHFTRVEDQSLSSIVESYKAENPGLARLRWGLIAVEYNQTVGAGREREPIQLAIHYRKLILQGKD